MNFTVIYVPTATDELTNIWLKASDRNAVTQASHEIDRILKYDADIQGLPYGNDRVLYAGPLAVTFTVSRDDCLVRILQARFIVS